MKYLLLALLLTAAGCKYEKTVVALDSAGNPASKITATVTITNAAACDKCSWVEQCKPVTDGKEFGIKMPNGDVHQLRWKTCKEVEGFIARMLSEERASCRKCSPKVWKEVDCK